MLTPTVIAVPIFALLIAVESFLSRKKGSDEFAEPRDTWNNIFIGLMSVVFGALFGLGTVLLYEWAYSIAPYRFPVPRCR